MNEVSVEIEAMVYPTEDREKVLAAIDNVATVQQISDVEIKTGIHAIRGKGLGKECLARLRDLIRQDRIRDAARALLYSAITAGGIQFYLNKQVAFANHVSFCDAEGESPLGPVSVRVECSDPAVIIDWLAPSMQARVEE